MSDDEIQIGKVRWCRDCERSGVASRLYYDGAQRISPTMTLIAFRCEHGHPAKVDLPDDIAQELIRRARSNGDSRASR